MKKTILALTCLLALPMLGTATRASSEEADKTEVYASPAGDYEYPALQSFVWSGDVVAMKEFFERNADAVNYINVADHWGTTPLHGAALTGNVEIMALLLDKGADSNARDAFQDTPLHFVAFAPANMAEATWLLVRNGADVNAQDIYGETPLHWAAYAGAVDTAWVLVQEEVGAKIDIADRSGQMALDEAMQENEEEVVELLLGAARNAQKTVQ